VGGLSAHQRRLVGGGDDHDRAGKPRFAQVVLQKFLHLAAALADEPDDGDIGVDVACEHRQQHRFADPGARENPHALAATAGDEGIERAHAEIERGANPATCMRQRRRVAKRVR
jgi:hypothetical protein